jgi:hypothetical protein
VVTPGQRGDCPQAAGLLSGLTRGTVGHVVADAAYDSDALRRGVRRLRARACIRPNPTRKRRKRYDRARYRHRNVIERFFCPYPPVPPARHAVRKEGRQLRGARLPRSLHHRGGLNVRTT